MTNTKTAPRHRKARRPLAPISDLASATGTRTPLRGTAFVSITGLALTAAVTSAASAAPVTVVGSSDASVDTTQVSALPTTVSVPDIAWAATDTVAASAEAPAPEPAPVVETQTTTTTTQAASRSQERATVTAEATGSSSTAASNPSGSSIVAIALSMQGIPYVYGGSSMAGADCSGFVLMVYAQAGISLPRTSQAQQAGGTIVSAASARPGDIVSWGYHVGIYIGDGMMVDSSKPGTFTSVRSVWGSPVYVRY